MKSAVKSIIALILALTLTATVCSAALSAGAKTADTVNVIVNGDFESGSTDPWVLSSDASLASVGHTGPKSLRLLGQTYYATPAKQEGITLIPNTDYTFSFWAKGDAATEGTKPYCLYIYSGSNKICDKWFNKDGDWKQYSVTFNSGAYTECFVKFTCSGTPDGSAIFIDDVALAYENGSGAAVKNGDFESASADPWDLSADTVLTSDAHAGGKALRLYASSAYARAAKQSDIGIEPNTDYILSYWSKGDPKASGSKGYHVYIFDASGATKIATEYFTPTAEWTLHTVAFNSGSFTSCMLNFSACSSPDGSAIIIDDVVLDKKPDEILIRNGGFEENGSSMWTTGGSTSVADIAHSGDHSLRLVGSSYYQSVAKQTGLILTKNTEYILVFWAKGDLQAGGSKPYHGYIFGDSENLCSNSINITENWTRYSLAFNSGDHTEWYINFSAGSSPDGSAIYVDDVEIIHREGSGYYGEYPQQLPEGADIRVVSFNLLVAKEDFDWSPWNITGRPEKLKAFVEYYKPDVLGLQECSEKWHDGIKQQLGDTYEFLNPDFGGKADENCSTLIYDKTKLRVVASEVYSYSVGNSPRFRLIDIGVFERISDGARFIVSSTHLDPGWEGSEGGDMTRERNIQAGELVAKAKAYIRKWNCPYISTGDMNCPAGDVPYNTIVNSGVLTDADTHPGTDVVDHIFHTVGTECVSTARLTDTDLQGTSDHYPLIADFKLTEMPMLYAPGDIDGDDKVTVSDALEALRMSVGLAKIPTDNMFAVADMDADGEITVSDALRILRIAAGIR